MGAFVLYQSAASLDINGAERVLARKGFAQPERVDLGVWQLLLCRKMLVDEPNWIRDPSGRRLCCVGTLVYRSLGYRASLERLLQDFRNGCIERGDLIGNFCAVLWDNQRVTLVSDPQNACQLFMNEERTCISSSFLAVLAAQTRQLSLNRVAFLEKLATGYIVGPDTLVDGILHLNDELKASLPRNPGIEVITTAMAEGEGAEVHRGGFRDSIHRQLEILKGYFHSIRTLDAEYRAELGLSNGYDSRLLLAMSKELLHPIPLHSHGTKGVHEQELQVARELAGIAKCPLTVVPTCRLEDTSEEFLKATIADNLYFFDGRCIHDMGAFSETYTADYRRRVLGPNRLSLHGLGGEIYRNDYCTPRGRFRFSDWQDACILFPLARKAFGASLGAALDHRNKKIARRLGWSDCQWTDHQRVREYYGKVRMVDCASCVSNAYNQVAFMLTPYIERRCVIEALAATRHIGIDGAYEAALIRESSPALASVGSQYGFAFANIPLKHEVKCWLKGVVSFRIRQWNRERVSLRAAARSKDRPAQERRRSSPTVEDLRKVLLDAMPHANWPAAMLCPTQMATSLYIGSFLKEFSDKLTW